MLNALPLETFVHKAFELKLEQLRCTRQTDATAERRNVFPTEYEAFDFSENFDVVLSIFYIFFIFIIFFLSLLFFFSLV